MISFVALGAALGAAGLASAQVALTPVAGPSTVGGDWSGGFNLGPVQAGNYSSYLIITNWGAGGGDPWSLEDRASLHGGPLGPIPGTSTLGPAGSGTVYAATAAAATGSANSGAAVNNMFWFGGLAAGGFSSDGTTDLYLSHRRTFTAGGTTSILSNMRVVLDPTVTDSRTLVGFSGPSAFTDLGQLSVGGTNQTIAVNNTATGPAGISWFRFTVNADVNSSNAFDAYTTPGPDGSLDTRLSVFRMTDNGLVPVASTDDMPSGALQGGVTFGSADTTAFGRDEYNTPAAAAGFFNGRGGISTLPAMAGFGYFAGTPGAATLMAGTEYFLAVSHFTGSLPAAALTGGGTFLSADELGVTLTGTVTASLPATGPGTALGEGNVLLNIRSIPAPGAIALLGFAGLVGSRRRRD
jgi:hypothetical protein